MGGLLIMDFKRWYEDNIWFILVIGLFFMIWLAISLMAVSTLCGYGEHEIKQSDLYKYGYNTTEIFTQVTYPDGRIEYNTTINGLTLDNYLFDYNWNYDEPRSVIIRHSSAGFGPSTVLDVGFKFAVSFVYLMNKILEILFLLWIATSGYHIYLIYKERKESL
jgi:hypothetical protein